MSESESGARERRWWRKYWDKFSFVGLAMGTLFFAASLTPSLLPRHFLVQGVLSGIAWAAGYAAGICVELLWRYLQLPIPRGRMQRIGQWMTTVAVLFTTACFLWRSTTWQNSIRQLMELEPVATAYPWRVASIALVTAVALIFVARTLRGVWRFFDRRFQRIVPRRISYVASLGLVVVLGAMLLNHVLGKLAIDAADAVFYEIDRAVDERMQQPADPQDCGGPDSLVPWDSIGRQGKLFISTGPTAEAIGEFWKSDAQKPLRVYVGMGKKSEMVERAKLALDELKRVGGFERSILIVATPTGTGWLDPGAVDTVEYLHRGNTAIVSMQYSYLPSWLTIMIDPYRSRDSARALFKEIYAYWRTLPRDQRPRLYLHGLSLGSLGSESSADIFTIFDDPIQGALWSGPPFPSPVWGEAVRNRNPDSPAWLPRAGQGSMLRFTGRTNSLDWAGARWGSMRFVYVQHASDPMTFFSPELLYRKPQWLIGPRGPDVSPYFRWFPIVTFLQAGFDIPMATSVPTGYGHNFAPATYIDAWIAVTDPPDWSPDKTDRLKRLLDK